MNKKYFNKHLALLVPLLGCLLVTACSQQVEHDSTTTEFKIGHTQAKVTHVNKYISNKGILSGHDYGSSYSFAYQLTVPDLKIDWQSRDEPKEAKLCQSNSLMLKSIGKHTSYTDEETVTKITTRYAKFVDNRFLFKLFGDAYWTYISQEDYLNQTTECVVAAVPNERHYE